MDDARDGNSNDYDGRQVTIYKSRGSPRVDGVDVLTFPGQYLSRPLPGTPLHISRFHPQFKLEHLPSTPVEIMHRAYEAARAAGLHFVYFGNLPGNPYQDTVCPQCGQRVIRRSGFRILANELQNGHCSSNGRVMQRSTPASA